MFMVLYDVLTSVVLVPLLYVELHFGVPLVMALLERLPFAAETDLAVFYILTSVLALPLLLGTVDRCAAALERQWPTSLSDALSGHASFTAPARARTRSRVCAKSTRASCGTSRSISTRCAKDGVWRRFARRHAASLTTSGAFSTPCPCGGAPTRSRRETPCATSTAC